MILQIQFIPITSIAESITVAWYAILNKVSRDTNSDSTLKSIAIPITILKTISAILAIAILYCILTTLPQRINDDENDRYYKELRSTIKNKNDFNNSIIVMGDINAKVR